MFDAFPTVWHVPYFPIVSPSLLMFTNRREERGNGSPQYDGIDCRFRVFCFDMILGYFR